MKRIVLYLITFAIPVVFAIAGDRLVGRFHDIETIRLAARQFREEAALLRFRTNNLVPGINHIYPTVGGPNEGGTEAGAGLRSFRTNRNGDVAGGTEAAAAATKILFLGGSTTECNEVDEPYRFPVVVEKVLRDLGLNVKAINAGVRSHTTQDSLNALLNRPGFRDEDVRIVVLMENINDRLWLGSRGGYFAELGTDGSTSGGAVARSAKAFIGAMVDYVVYRSNSLFLLRYWKNENAAWIDQTWKGEVTEGAIDRFQGSVLLDQAKFEKNLIVFVRLVRALDKRPVLMTQPLGRHSDAQDRFNDSIRKVADREQVTLVDLDRELTGDRGWAFLFDNIHLNAHGSIAVGTIIAAAVAQLVATSIEKPGSNP